MPNSGERWFWVLESRLWIFLEAVGFGIAWCWAICMLMVEPVRYRRYKNQGPGKALASRLNQLVVEIAGALFMLQALVDLPALGTRYYWMVHWGGWVIPCSNQYRIKNLGAETNQGRNQCLILILEQNVGHSIWEVIDLLGSESGHFGPSPSSGLLHHLKQVWAPFWVFVSLVDCVPQGLWSLLLSMFFSPAWCLPHKRLPMNHVLFE